MYIHLNSALTLMLQKIKAIGQGHFYTDIVLNDIQLFAATSTSPDILKEYAEAKGFDVQKFREFSAIVNEFAKTDTPKQTVNTLLVPNASPEVYFYLTPDQQADFKPILDYYKNLSDLFDLTNDSYGSIRNGVANREYYWKQKGYNYPAAYTQDGTRPNVPANYLTRNLSQNPTTDHFPTLSQDNNTYPAKTIYENQEIPNPFPLTPTAEEKTFESYPSKYPYNHKGATLSSTLGDAAISYNSLTNEWGE